MHAFGHQYQQPLRRGRLARLPQTAVLLVTLALWAGEAFAAHVHIIVANDAPYYLQAATSLRERLAVLSPETKTALHTELPTHTPSSDLLVTIGSDAMAKLRAHLPERWALHLFITSDAWAQQLAKDPGVQANSALVLDPPPRHLVALAKTLLPAANTMAVILGPISRKHLDLVHREAETAGLEPLIGVLSPDANPLATLSPLVDAADVALVLPDSADFNRAAAKWLLQLGFRARTPIIAFSRAYANAGALASVFVTPEDIGYEGAGLIHRNIGSGSYETGMRYPEQYSIATNRAVAAALHIELPDDEALKAHLTFTLEALP